MNARRLPIVVALLAVVIAAVIVDPVARPQAVTTEAVAAAMLGPLANASDAGTSTWYCAGGTAAVTGAAEQTITVANPNDEAARGTVEVYLEGQPPQAFPIEVGARAQERVVLSTLVQGEWAAALVEIDHGGVVVTHEVLGVGGWDSDRCSSQTSDRWYLPWGQTLPQDASSLRLALFNPFAVEAVVDISFDTDDGFRRSEALQGFLVPPRRLVTVDVTEIVPVRQRISTSVVARSGRLVVDGVQTLNGVDGTLTLDVTPAAPAAATAWYFADGRVDGDTLERIAVFNPSEETAEVEIVVERPRVAQDLAIEPFVLQIASQSYAEVVLNDERRIPQPLRHTTMVRSLNGVGVVAERVQLSSTVREAAAAPPDDTTATTAPTTAETTPTSAPTTEPTTSPPTAPGTEPPASTAGVVALPPGLAASLGSPVVATRWVLPNAGRADALSKVVINNTSASQPVAVTVHGYAGGQAVPIEPSGATSLEPRQQIEVPVTADAAGSPVMVIVEADGPIVVDGVQVFAPFADTSFQPATPLRDGVRVANPLEANVPAPSVTSGGEGTVPSTAPDGTGSTAPSSATTTATTVATPTTPAPTVPDPASTTTSAPAAAVETTAVGTGETTPPAPADAAPPAADPAATIPPS